MPTERKRPVKYLLKKTTKERATAKEFCSIRQKRSLFLKSLGLSFDIKNWNGQAADLLLSLKMISPGMHQALLTYTKLLHTNPYNAPQLVTQKWGCALACSSHTQPHFLCKENTAKSPFEDLWIELKKELEKEVVTLELNALAQENNLDALKRVLRSHSALKNFQKSLKIVSKLLRKNSKKF